MEYSLCSNALSHLTTKRTSFLTSLVARWTALIEPYASSMEREETRTRQTHRPVGHGGNTSDISSHGGARATGSRGLKLNVDTDNCPTEALRMGYVENRVGGIAIKHLAPMLRNDATQPFQSAEEMLEVLERVYMDPYRKQTAYQAFQNLYQGRQDFHTF